MATTFNDDEAYALFIIVDTMARVEAGENPTTMHLRERLRPVYRAWHKANPGKAHPASHTATQEQA